MKLFYFLSYNAVLDTAFSYFQQTEGWLQM